MSTITWTPGRIAYAIRHPRRTRRLIKACNTPLVVDGDPTPPHGTERPLAALELEVDTAGLGVARGPLPLDAWGTEAVRINALEELAR